GSAWCEAGRPSSRATDQVRTRHQSDHSQGDRPHRARQATRRRRRGDRVRRRAFITLISGAVAWPLAARAQPVPVIGVLRPNRQPVVETFAEPFRRYMKAIGWEEGRNIRFLFAWTEGRSERASALAGELVAHNVDLIITFGDPAIR